MTRPTLDDGPLDVALDAAVDVLLLIQYMHNEDTDPGGVKAIAMQEGVLFMVGALALPSGGPDLYEYRAGRELVRARAKTRRAELWADGSDEPPHWADDPQGGPS